MCINSGNRMKKTANLSEVLGFSIIKEIKITPTLRFM